MELEPRAAVRVAKGTMIKVGLCLQKVVSFTFVGGTAASKDITLDFPVKGSTAREARRELHNSNEEGGSEIKAAVEAFH